MNILLALSQALALTAIFLRVRRERELNLPWFAALLGFSIIHSLLYSIYTPNAFIIFRLVANALCFLASRESLLLILDRYPYPARYDLIWGCSLGSFAVLALGAGVSWRFGGPMTITILSCIMVAAFQAIGVGMLWKIGWWRNGWKRTHATLLLIYFVAMAAARASYWFVESGQAWRAVNYVAMTEYILIFVAWAALFQRKSDQPIKVSAQMP